MIVLIRLEAEAPTLEEVIQNLDGAEKAVLALQQPIEPPSEYDPRAHAVPLNVGVTDEHYERQVGNPTAHFKGRRVVKFLGRAEWDDNSDMEKPQPRLAAAFNIGGTNATAVPSYGPVVHSSGI